MNKASLVAVIFVTIIIAGWSQNSELSFSAKSINLPKIDRNVKYLFVRGFMSDPVKNFEQNFGWDVSYFSDYRRLLALSGVENEMVEIDSEASIYTNGKIIRNLILASKKPVVLVGHSKGGLDILEALRLLSVKNFEKKIKATIFIQVPFYGTPIANAAIKILGSKSKKLLLEDLLGGNHESLIELSTKSREFYMNQARTIAALRNILNIPHVIVRSTVDDNAKISFSYRSFDSIIKGFGQRSDGLVPYASASFPGAKTIDLKNIDHLGLVKESYPTNLNRSREFAKMIRHVN